MIGKHRRHGMKRAAAFPSSRPCETRIKKRKRTTRRRAAPREGASRSAARGGWANERGSNRKRQGTSAGAYPLDDSSRHARSFANRAAELRVRLDGRRFPALL